MLAQTQELIDFIMELKIYINLKNRDEKDIEDKNFIKPVDVIEIDTTNLTIDEALEEMLSHIERND